MHAAVDDDWDAALRAAFELLLGRSIGDGEPAEIYCGDVLDEFLLPARWLTPQALAGGAPVAVPEVDATWADADHAALTWRYDLGGSRFAFDEELRDQLPAACFAAGGVRGADLAAFRHRPGGAGRETVHGGCVAAHRHGRDAVRRDAAGDIHRARTQAAHREHQEGRRAVGAGPRRCRGPAAARDHLRLHALDEDDARSDGAGYIAAGWWPPGSSALEGAYDLIAGWEFGESQGGVSIVGPRP
ncbi:hypothetical protein ACFPIJ_58465 [Dactylosporangium cerinum]|uniref:Uncharacterized protein n=1 Tax=Dactylosporangium cerinum TaxID=1434730 RepID=A0ABV9WHM5_9ACTN